MNSFLNTRLPDQYLQINFSDQKWVHNRIQGADALFYGTDVKISLILFTASTDSDVRCKWLSERWVDGCRSKRSKSSLL